MTKISTKPLPEELQTWLQVTAAKSESVASPAAKAMLAKFGNKAATRVSKASDKNETKARA
jgi:hypothetical protein